MTNIGIYICRQPLKTDVLKYYLLFNLLFTLYVSSVFRHPQGVHITTFSNLTPEYTYEIDETGEAKNKITFYNFKTRSSGKNYWPAFF
jgi:hypothetical protein